MDDHDDPAPLVAGTYDALAPDYDDWAESITPPLRNQYLDQTLALLPPRSKVLEVGCGTGLPVAAGLAEWHTYLGVDLSPGMIEQARRNVPGGEFRVGDMRNVDLPEAPFDAVLAFYSIIHVPREDHPAVFRRIHGLLRAGGWFVASFGAGDTPAGTDPDWLEAGPMFWSSYDAATTRSLLADAGFDVVRADIHVQQEPEMEVRWLWVVCRA